MVYEKHQPRQLWRLGRVIEAMPSGVEYVWWWSSRGRGVKFVVWADGG